MEFNKEEFLETELGVELTKCIDCLDMYLRKQDYDSAVLYILQWQVYQMAIKQFYGIEYDFSRTDEHYGLVTVDGKDWLYKVERKQERE